MNALRVVVLAVALMGAMGQGKAPDPLIQARQLYNEQRYDAAIAQLAGGIRQHLFSLPDDTVVLPGHGPATTVGREKRTNPYVGDDRG